MLNSPLTLSTVDRVAKHLSLASDARITFIDDSGKVMGDSMIPIDQVPILDNHLNRPEIQLAQVTGIGISRHFSRTLNEEYIYVAIYRSLKVGGGTSGYYARASLPDSTIYYEVIKLRLALASIAIVSMLTLILLSFISSRWIARSVEQDRLDLKSKIDSGIHDIELLHELDSMLGACSELSEAGSVVKQVTPRLLPNSSGAISIYKSSRNKLEFIMFWGEEWQGVTEFKPEQCWALRKGHSHQSDHNDTQIYCEHFSHLAIEQGNKASLCIPLMALGEAIGVMHILKKEFPYSDLLLTNAIAKRVGLAIANIELRYSLRQQAIKDTLTGLFNRRYLFESLEQLVALGMRNKSQIGIIMGDIDHFKSFNDSYGHDAGDDVLKEVAKELKKNTRIADIVCRYGGEEFCIVCPDSTQEETLLIAEKLRLAVAKKEVKLSSKEMVTVTISMGVAMFTNSEDSIKSVISEADRRLYQAKSDGRNCVRGDV
ncbi:diguanylate cyclase [Shewanella psychrophila]|uniref:sensor domain-containing diguanylate cyclase n=1 Tax=Shewanella psychrophila TaxID=225848 RepID=UPI0014737F35|nr:diguanylate cyclase [Shewanella psychrophila]